VQASTRRYANPQEVQLVRWLIQAGLNDSHISRATGVSRPTVREWRFRANDWPEHRTIRRPEWSLAPCPRCDGQFLDQDVYAYLLGLYLGDGTISKQPRGSSYRLRIVCANAYPGLIARCKDAMKRVKRIDRDPGVIQREGCVEVNMGWAHWPCLFPQHGRGPKHERPIYLAPWQQRIVASHPEELLTGLIHSDGWRGTNRVTRRWGSGEKAKSKIYSYPRYQFSNNSEDILRIFTDACDLLDVRWRRMNWNVISVARRPDVAKLDTFIGLKQ
jgi:hypothetical protein